MLLAFPQMDFPLGRECILLALTERKTCNVFENVTAGIHAEAAWKFTFQAFISLCRKICCDKQTHKTGFFLWPFPFAS